MDALAIQASLAQWAVGRPQEKIAPGTAPGPMAYYRLLTFHYRQILKPPLAQEDYEELFWGCGTEKKKGDTWYIR